MENFINKNNADYNVFSIISSNILIKGVLQLHWKSINFQCNCKDRAIKYSSIFTASSIATAMATVAPKKNSSY